MKKHHLSLEITLDPARARCLSFLSVARGRNSLGRERKREKEERHSSSKQQAKKEEVERAQKGRKNFQRSSYYENHNHNSSFSLPPLLSSPSSSVPPSGTMLRTFVSEVASRGLRVQAVPALSRGFATSTFD